MPPEVITLSAGELCARWVPSVGMVGASLTHRGAELLGQRGGLEAYAARGSTFGIPLLAPWANRLGGFAYSAAGVDVALDAGSPRVRTEEHGLPIHGLLAAHPGWRVVERSETALAAELVPTDDPDVAAAFPFPHRLRLDVALDPARLAVTTTVTPTSDVPVPIAFGFHPYLTLPGVAREDVVLRAGPMTRLLLDDRGLPSGAWEPVPARDERLGRGAIDEHFTDLGAAPAFTLAGGARTIVVRFAEGYTHLQLFAEAGQPFVAVEPMTAPIDALRTGEGLRLATSPFRATFTIAVDAAP